MRIVKEHDERRNEILDAAEKLFYEKGYDKCTISDILETVGIAKGTFYYYFKSKEEVLDAIVTRINETVIKKANDILNSNELSPDEKLMKTFASMRMPEKVNEDMLENIHRPENALLHQKTWSQIVVSLAPILEKIVEEGIQKKIWSCKYPLQYMQIILVSSLVLTDEGIFDMNEDSQFKIITALISLLEKMLNMPEGYFISLFEKYFGM